MNTDIDYDFAVAMAITGIARLARKGDFNKLFAALNFITGQDARPPEIMTEDIFSAYESAIPQKSEKTTLLVDGLRSVYANGNDVAGIENAVSGFEQITPENLQNALGILEFSAGRKQREAIRNAVLRLSANKSGAVENLSPQLVGKILSGHSYGFGVFDKAIVYFREKGEAPQPGFIEPLKFSEKEKLRLAFAATVDNLVYQYSSFIFMKNSKMCHDFFLGLGNFAAPRQRIDAEFDYLDKKRFETLMDSYGFNSNERSAMETLISRFGKFAVPRAHFWRIKNHLVGGGDGLISAISQTGSVQITSQMSDNLELYNLVSGVDIKTLMLLAQSPMSDLEKQKKADDFAASIMQEAVPQIYRSPCAGIAELFELMNFSSRMNELAKTHCSGVQGNITSGEAERFLLEYANQTRYPFEEKKVIDLIRSH